MERCLWCCKAATAAAPNLRTRILYLLDAILTSEDSPLVLPLALQTILPSVALLVWHCQNYDLSRSISLANKPGDLKIVYELIAKIMDGNCGHLDMDELEQKFQALALKTDTEDDLRRGLGVKALSICLGTGMLDQKRVILRMIEV